MIGAHNSLTSAERRRSRLPIVGQSGHGVGVTGKGVTRQSLDSDLAVVRGVGGVAAVLLRGGDEYLARAELRPAQRGQRGAPRPPLRRSQSPAR